MAYRKGNAMTGSIMTKALGKMVGLLLSLYVFDEVVSAITPNLWTCANNASFPTLVTANATFSAASCTNGTATIAAVTTVDYFSTAMTFIGNLFPVIGILGAFEIIYEALKGARLV